MRKSKVLARIRAGQPARLAHMGYFFPPFIAYAAQAGYDGVWLDLEHHVMEGREVQALLAFFHRYDMDCMLRPSTREKGQLYRYLEDGVTGFMMPHVSTAAIAAELVSKVKFPPIGDRGVEGYGFEANFGLDWSASPEPLIEHANRETFVFVQIETPEGLSNVEEIAAVEGVDGLFVGPYDLGSRMRHLPPAEQVPLDAVLRRVAEACGRYGKAWGSFTTTLEAAQAILDQGAQILSLGADFLLLKDGLMQTGYRLSQIVERKSSR